METRETALESLRKGGETVKKLLFIALAVVLALGVGLVGCTGEGEVGPEGTAYIGGTFPLTGPYPEDGAAVLAAFQHYAEWVNDNHKISPWGAAFPEGVVLEVTFLDDAAALVTAQTNYDTMMAAGYKQFRVSGSAIATGMKDQLITDEVAATTMASGPYLVVPTVGTIFSNYPIYTDQCAGIADWFVEEWTDGGNITSPRVAYLTNTTFGQTLKTAAMNEYLESIGCVVVEGCPAVPHVPANPAETATALSWCQNNTIDLTLGAMLVVGASMTMTQADTMGIGVGQAYEMQIGLCSPAHLTIFLRDTGGTVGDGLIIAGSYPPWTDTESDGVQFCIDLMDDYGEGFDEETHIMYQHGVVEAMIQTEAIRRALATTAKTDPADLTTAEVLAGFRAISALDTGGIIPTTMTYGTNDCEGADKVRLDRNDGGVDVHAGDYPLRHVY
jgi:hypothetical protein